MSIFDAEIDIEHQVSMSTGTDTHGNETFGFGDPIPRKAIAIYPIRWQSPRRDPIDAETIARTETNLIVDVQDATIYAKNDRILIGGRAYRVQNEPRNWGSDAPFGLDASMFGGAVHVERIT